ncbi:hypothetical protein ABW19_dt0202085 [Dactylella cylindrospora]|nr:hypothetical protein ABW19_dt0202085 [Dactylella cylindrospora]
MSLNTFIQRMPKVELHIHLEGALEPAMVRAFAARNGMDIPKGVFGPDGNYLPFDSLKTFLQVYYGAMTVLQKPVDFADLLVEYLHKARRQKVMYAEIFFDPQAHERRGVSLETVLEGIDLGIRSMIGFRDIRAKMIMCFLRDADKNTAEHVFGELLKSRYRHHVIGVGLDSDEKCHPPIQFKDLFKAAKENGFKLTMHCDIDQFKSAEHIRQAIEDVGVDRIDHGTNIVERPELVKEIKEKDIGLTCCPISNSFVVEDFKGPEIVGLLRENVKVCINSDDPAFMGGYITENLVKLLEVKLVDPVRKDEIVQTQVNAINMAWVTSLDKQHMRRALQRYVDGSWTAEDSEWPVEGEKVEVEVEEENGAA